MPGDYVRQLLQVEPNAVWNYFVRMIFFARAERSGLHTTNEISGALLMWALLMWGLIDVEVSMMWDIALPFYSDMHVAKVIVIRTLLKL